MEDPPWSRSPERRLEGGSVGPDVVAARGDAATEPGSPVSRSLVLGSRTSRLARRQAELVADSLRSAWPEAEVEIRGITTRGDRVLDLPLPEIGGKGLFTAELEAALLGGEIDLAVHSLKDLPTDLPEGLALVAVPEREDPRDVLVGPEAGGSIETLPRRAVVGTSSLRRRAQLLALRPDLRVRDIRGNVETRVAKCHDGDFDAVVLAAAGLRRLGMTDAVAGWLSSPEWLPAPAQGALGLEGRVEDPETEELLEPIRQPALEAEIRAERILLQELDAGCRVPLGARCRRVGEELILDAGVFLPDGTQTVRVSARSSLDDAAGLGRRVAGELRDRGAGEILDRVREEEDLP